jgi:nicotinamide mononucleotide (NMN) deamidase PncC
MHKRFGLIASLAAIVAAAIPVSAAVAGETVTGPDGNTQSIEAGTTQSCTAKAEPKTKKSGG